MSIGGKVLLKTIKNVLRPIKLILILIKNYYHDLKRYYIYTHTHIGKLTLMSVEADIIKHYHVLEKGLSMPEVKKGFGLDVATSLITLCEHYFKLGYSVENYQIRSALNVLKKYIDYNSQFVNLSDMEERFDKIVLKTKINTENTEGGYKNLSKEEVNNITNADFKIFSANRYSIRNYSERDVDTKLLEDAIKIAQKSPSVCNRQGSKVYIVSDKDLISKTLKFQNGNRGFGHLANKLLIVTSDLRVFEGVHERNQSFIDGGLFAMSLLYGLHYNGLGACPLNWCTDYHRDQKLKKSIGINDYENIIMMISVGHLQDEFKVAVSPRKDLEDIITFIGN
jgi:nitroreductase